MGNLGGSSSAINSTPEALANQFGQKATVIKMSMGQENSIQRRGWNGKRFPVPVFELSFLVESTVYQKPDIVGFQKILGTGNIISSTEKT